MKKVVTFAVITALAFLVNYSFALEYPKFPEQAKKDWEVSVSAEVAKIGPLKGAAVLHSIEARVGNCGITTRAQYDPGVPDAGEVWLSVGSR